MLLRSLAGDAAHARVMMQCELRASLFPRCVLRNSGGAGGSVMHSGEIREHAVSWSSSPLFAQGTTP
jgi:hypothetical protein